MSNETIPINLWIAGRDYRIRIHPKDEESVRAAIKMAADRIAHLRDNYDGKDDQDFLAMCLIMYATENISGAKESDPLYMDELKKMEQQVDEILKS